MKVEADRTVAGVSEHEDGRGGARAQGYVRNVERMMSTLGGEDALAQARSTPVAPLELRYRPDDPLSHGLYGEVHRTPANLLLRLTRPRQPPAAEQVFARRISFASSSASCLSSAG
jgi:hypothetical protein